MPLIGLDILQRDAATVLKKRDLALVTGSANCDSRGVPAWQVVQRLAGPRLTALWSLQHGFFVDKQDNMIFSDSFVWPEAGLPVRSLYGPHPLPQPEWWRGLDAVLIDVFDVGTRVYTFLNHLVMLMCLPEARGVNWIVLDRPNPLNGLDLEGPPATADHFSIVGRLPVPMRHGLSAAEYLRLAAAYYKLDIELEIVRVEGWRRADFFRGIWTYPSPNMPGLSTALVYPGAVLLEGTNLSEGRGTTRPFEFVGAPWFDHLTAAAELSALRPPGVKLVPVYFKPEFSKYAGEVCRGLQIEVTAPRRFRSFAVYYEIIRFALHRHGDRFQWKSPPYEYEHTRPPIDMINGSSLLRAALEADRPYREVETVIAPALREYAEGRQSILLYP